LLYYPKRRNMQKEFTKNNFLLSIQIIINTYSIKSEGLFDE